MNRLIALTLAIATALLVAGCNGGGKSAEPPAMVQAAPGESSVVVSFAMEPNVSYWLFYAPSSELTSTNFTSVPGGRVLIDAASPQRVSGLTNGTTYYFTINGRTGGGPGGSGTALISATPRSAGETWIARPALVSGDLRGAAYGTTFVVVGASGAMFSSPDGVSWTAIGNAVTSDLNAVFYGIGGYTAVGAGGVVLLSPDAITWTPVNSTTSKQLYAGASNGVINLAVGSDGVFSASADGTVWGAGIAGTTNHLYGLAYGVGRWVAVGASGTIVTSTDASTWQAVASQTTSDLRAVAYGANAARFVAVGAGGTVVTSQDGVNWTAGTAISASALTSVSFITRFVAVGAGGSIFTSADGISWQAASSGTTGDLNTVAAGNFRFLAAGAAGTNLYAE